MASTTFNLVLCAITFAAASLSLRRAMAAEALGGSAIRDGKKPSRKERKHQARQNLAPPAEARGEAPNAVGTTKKRRVIHHSGASRSVGDQPVLWRELRQSAFRSRSQMWIVAAVLLFVLAILDWQAGLDEEGLHFTVAAVTTLAVICIAAVSTTAGISGERESRTWEALLTTPLSARQVVLGKFLGAVRRQWFVPAIFAAQLIVAALYSLHDRHGCPAPWLGLYALPVLSAPILALSGTGVLFSLVCRKSTAAAACNFGLALLVWLAAPIAAIMITSTLLSGSAREDGLSLLCCINPVAMMMTVMESSMRSRFELFTWSNVGLPTFTFVVALYWLLLAATGVLSTLWAGAILASRSARSK
jgi:ABC-type transport system involved in multi-copper enzyme maturation permease subunit